MYSPHKAPLLHCLQLRNLLLRQHPAARPVRSARRQTPRHRPRHSPTERIGRDAGWPCPGSRSASHLTQHPGPFPHLRVGTAMFHVTFSTIYSPQATQLRHPTRPYIPGTWCHFPQALYPHFPLRPEKGFTFQQEKSCICSYTPNHTPKPSVQTRIVNKMPKNRLTNLSSTHLRTTVNLLTRQIKGTLL